jgi:hypothetical protein
VAYTGRGTAPNIVHSHSAATLRHLPPAVIMSNLESKPITQSYTSISQLISRRNIIPAQGISIIQIQNTHTPLKLIAIDCKFTAKTLNRQAKKAQKDENTEKTRLKKVSLRCSLISTATDIRIRRPFNKATMTAREYTPPMPSARNQKD